MIVEGKRGQVTIFVIVAIALVLGIIIFFFVRGSLVSQSIPQELQPVFSYYQECVEQETERALSIAGTQGGRVNVGDYIPGSDYSPFSNHLNFLGNSVPYWYYLSGNGILRENIPTESELEGEIGIYLEENLINCDFGRFYEQGYSISSGNPSVRVRIEDQWVSVDVASDLIVEKDGEAATKSTHSAQVDSKIGKFLNLAGEIYSKEKSEAFLENYGVDVLRLYAPVDGVEIECSPQVWKTNEIVEDLQSALENNVAALKLKGDYYDINEKKDEYFVVDLDTDENVQFMYSRDWPTKIEIDGEGVEEGLLVAEPVGTQQGLGVMGFCYVPYHYVYDLYFPVMVQIYDSEELFQFPIVVIVDNNLARDVETSGVYQVDVEEFDFCKYKTEDVEINIYDSNLNPIDSNVSYECFSQRCSIGESKGGQLIGQVPACVNGYLNFRTEGYADKKQLFSSNEEVFADVILEKEYDVELDVNVGGDKPNENVIVSFSKEDGDSVSAVLPEVRNVKLTEGQYEVRVYVYADSQITIPSSSRKECREVARGGLAGFFGGTEEECFDIVIPETKIESALIGGGSSDIYLLGSDLEKGKMIIDASSLPVPSTLEQLQNNFIVFEESDVEVRFE